MTSFFSYPVNFNARFSFLKDIIFLSIFNNDLAYDGLIFFHAFMLGYKILKRENCSVKYSIKICVEYMIRTFIPVFILVIWSMSLYTKFSTGPMWSTNGSRIVYGCDQYWWSNVFFLSNIVPWVNTFDSA